MAEKDTPPLAKLPIFDGLDLVSQAEIAGSCRWRRFSSGQHVLHHNESSSDLFFVTEGTLRVLVYSPQGKDVSYRDLDPGEFFGELAAIDHGPRAASVVALTDATLMVMTHQAFLSALERHPVLMHQMMRHLVALIRQYSQRVYELSALGVEDRIRAELLRLGYEHTADGTTALVTPAPTLAELASRIGTTREAVSREISSLNRHAICKREGNALVIRDLHALAQLVETAMR